MEKVYIHYDEHKRNKHLLFLKTIRMICLCGEIALLGPHVALYTPEFSAPFLQQKPTSDKQVRLHSSTWRWLRTGPYSPLCHLLAV